MVTWKNIQRGEGMSGEKLGAFLAERSQHALEVELQNGPPGKKLYLLPGWEREQWEYASREEARMDWALMIIPREEYREKLLQYYPDDDPDAFLVKMVSKGLLFEISLEDGTVGILHSRDFHEKHGGLEKPERDERSKKRRPGHRRQ